MHCVGSRAELARMMKSGCVPEDLHREHLDDLALACPKCGGSMRREPFVLDCWFDSGCAFFAADHYPFRGQTSPPPLVDFVAEGMDQTRGWFYTLLAVATSVFGRHAYKSVLALGLVVDQAGKKMSKSRGNTLEPARLFFTRGSRCCTLDAGARQHSLVESQGR
jgi:isoleucyl-tRNA synthetase